MYNSEDANCVLRELFWLDVLPCFIALHVEAAILPK